MRYILLVFLLVVPLTLDAQERDEIPLYIISVSVSADDAVKNVLTSYLHRELRDIDGVSIQDDPMMELRIILIETSGVYAASVVYAERLNPDFINDIIAYTMFTDESEDSTDVSYFAYREYLDEYEESVPGAFVRQYLDMHGYAVGSHFLYIDPDLRSLAARIVADVDIYKLDSVRDAQERLSRE